MERRHRPTPRRRAVKSCDRCRRQKLKCDPSRPCLLCVHSGSKCESTQNGAHSRETPRQRRSAKKPSNGTSLEETVQGPNPVSASENPLYQRGSEQPATNASSVNFARQVFNEAETGRSLTHGVIPGDTGISGAVRSTWCLKELQLPPNELMWAAIDAYFCRTHWLLGLVHEPSLRMNANRILASATWERQDMGHVLLVLTVAALGLKATMNDMTWPGHRILSFLDLNSCDLMKTFVSEIRLHLMDLMEDSRIESVQICMLLSSLYGYHGSPSLAWTLARMAINAAIYLELYRVTPGEESTINAQVRQHSWNTIMILDTYTSIIYGRPVSTDAGFVRLHTIQDRQELRIDSAILNLPVMKDVCDTPSVAPFYTAQFRLYEHIRGSILRRTQIQSITILDSEIDRFEAAARCASDSEALLRQLFKELPLMYRLDTWTQNNRWEHFAQSLRDLPPKLQEIGNLIPLQAASLQITYDSALILVHRPLLESRITTTGWSNFMVESVKTSLRVAVEAALRISRFPVHLFQNHYSISFVNFHLFTAGVILCLVPPTQPFTPSAQEAKAGILRIIQACRAIRDKDRTAQYTENILAEILKVTTTRETRIALGSPEDAEKENSASGPGSSAHDRSHQAIQSDLTGQNASHDISANIQSPFDPYIPPPTNQSPATVRTDRWTEDLYQNSVADGPVSMNTTTNLASIHPGMLVEPQALQQSDEIFGPFGKSMLNLFYTEQPRGWSMHDISLVPGVDTGENTFF